MEFLIGRGGTVVDQEKAKKQIKQLFMIRVCLWVAAFISTCVWIWYSWELYRQEIFDPHEYATRLRPVLYICLGIAIVSIIVSFILHAKSSKIKRQLKFYVEQ